MSRVRDVVSVLDTLAPPEYAFEWDNVGLQVGDPDATVRHVLVTLDASFAALDRAEATGADMVLAHHPLFFHPLKHLREDGGTRSKVSRLVRSHTAFAAAHTNWDCAPDGLNDALASRLSLREVKPLGRGVPGESYKLITFVPEKETDQLLNALANAGAGLIGGYERCAYYHGGTGTFRGTEGTNPTIGQAGKIEEVRENRLEMAVEKKRLGAVIAALHQAHPYEEPAYDVQKLLSETIPAAGRLGKLAEPMGINEFIRHVDAALGTRSLAWGNPEKITKVAVFGGAGGSEWRAAKTAGADAFVTGEVKQHEAVDAAEQGLLIVAAGHYATEQPGMAHLADRLKKNLTEVEVDLFEPLAGTGGRAH
ncbi:MAG: Nif3-like dinuclear metal center hexameric protein [Fimbriimonadaceae bacterium]